MKNPRPAAPPSAFVRTLRKILPPLILMPSVAFILSAFMTWANVGFGEAYLSTWGRSFLSSLVILPLVLASLGPLERLVNRLFPALHPFARKLVVSLLTAFAIESVLALAVTTINSPWDSSMGRYWWMAFSRSLPVGVLIGLFMAFYVKPKLDRMMQAGQTAQA
jgi:hypothetical protein